MQKNVIVMTNGLAGSSVLTGLLARAGYWSGEDTFKKSDYDTFENRDLIALNKALLAAAEFAGDYEMVYEPAFIDAAIPPPGRVDPAPYLALIAECDRHGPWIWKDPRLWLTIRTWRHWLDLDQVQFVLVTREPLQAWISTTIRRQIQTPAYLSAYMDGIRDSILAFFHDQQVPYLHLVYEDLLVHPEASLARLNRYLGTGLTVADLRGVYRGPLYRKPRGLADLVKAGLIYLKNYGQRYR